MTRTGAGYCVIHLSALLEEMRLVLGREPGRRSRAGPRSCSALALLVAQVLADDHDPAVTADHLALVADLLDARLNLHSLCFESIWHCRPGRAGRSCGVCGLLAVAEDDPATGQVVRAQLN